MSKINQIQTAILALDGGAFQKLADSYLLKKGYPQIDPVGSCSGSNKVQKGTPDTVIAKPCGMYIFAEYTTISKDLVFNKFCNDIDNCFDEKKTGIPVSKVEEIVLCCTSNLLPKNRLKLQNKCKSKGVNINIYGIGSISYDLLEKYPGIAKDHLGIEVDTGQIVPLDRFISMYERNKLAATLKTKFHFREEDKAKFIELIKDNDLVVLTGPPGVGKTRFAIECYQYFSKDNRSYKPYCVFNHGVGLCEDVKSYFSDSGDYLIFVDDANRVSGFQYIMSLFQSKRIDQKFKIIITVRDYALDSIRGIYKPFSRDSEIELLPFTDGEIEKLVQDEFGINNGRYLDRIAGIARGNPRLAVMAARVAEESNTLESLRDVSGLYEEYYSTIKSDLGDLQDETVLKVSGIVAFFRSVDRENSDLMLNINRAFKISTEDFWKASKKLHDMEIFDMFENEVVKISDQVLASYLFYLVFFKEKINNFSSLIIDLFPQYKKNLVDAVYPVLDFFSLDKTKDVMRPLVDRAWCQMQARDEKTFLQLVEVFWFLKPTETLVFIRNKIEGLDNQTICIDEIEFKENGGSSLPNLISILSLFKQLGINEIVMSLSLVLKYAEKNPQYTPSVLYCFVNRYGFQSNSYCSDYNIQHAVVDELLKRCDSGKNEYFTRMFIALAKNYLYTHFHRVASKGSAIIFTKFDLVESTGLYDLRKKIWGNLFAFCKDTVFQKYVLGLMWDHVNSGSNLRNSSIIEQDSKAVLQFFCDYLTPSDLGHCIVVQKYLGLLKRFKIPHEGQIKKRFTHRSFVLYDMIYNKTNRIDFRLDFDSCVEYKKKKIEKLSKSYSKEDYDTLFEDFFSVAQSFDSDSELQMSQGVALVFEELAGRNSSLYGKVVEQYLKKGDKLKINSYFPVLKLILSCGATAAFDILSNVEFLSKKKWLFSFYQNLSEENIKKYHLSALIDLYKTSGCEDLPNDVDFLSKYEIIETGFLLKIIRVVVNRSFSDPLVVRSIFMIFSSHTKVSEELISLFSLEMTLLEDAYIAVDKLEPHVDCDGVFFSKLLDNNRNFIVRYFEGNFEKCDLLKNHGYECIWRHDDCLDIMAQVTEIFFKHEKEYRCFDCYKVLFNKIGNHLYDEDLMHMQDEFLCGEISKKNCKISFMRMLFSVVDEFETDRRVEFYQKYLDENKNIEDFKSLLFGSSILSWEGSKVPVLQKEVVFYESIQSMCNSVCYLDHREFVEEKIRYLREEMQSCKKSDFAKFG